MNTLLYKSMPMATLNEDEKEFFWMSSAPIKYSTKL